MTKKLSLVEDRRSDLRRYVIKCVAQNIISIDELKNSPLTVLARLGSTLLADVTAIGREARNGLGTAASETAGRAFMEMARLMEKK